MPADYVNKLARMFQDIKVSEDLNQAFKEMHKNNKLALPGIIFVIYIYIIYVFKLFKKTLSLFFSKLKMNLGNKRYKDITKTTFLEDISYNEI